jgi:hypothetical protein
MRSLGDLVVLRHGIGYGSLNTITLYEHGLRNDKPVEIVKVAADKYNPNGSLAYDYQVRLPDGYPLDIDEVDINKLATEELDFEVVYESAQSTS